MEIQPKVSAKQIVYLDQSFNSYDYFITGNDKNLKRGNLPSNLQVVGRSFKT